jgi:hypothetical protein
VISVFGKRAGEYLSPSTVFGPATIIGRFKRKWLEEAHWFGGHRLFVGSENAEILRRVVGTELVLEPVRPHEFGLTELLPCILRRSDVFPELKCRECGSRETDRPDWERVDSLIAEILPRTHLMNTPRGILCTDRFRTAFIQLPGVRFENFELSL